MKGSVIRYVGQELPLDNNWNTWYREHRLRVLNARSVINSQPQKHESPEARTLNYIDLMELMCDVKSLNEGRTFSRTPESMSETPKTHFTPLRSRLLRPAFRRKPKPIRNLKRRLIKQKLKQLAALPFDPDVTVDIPSYVLKRFEFMALPQELTIQLLRPCIYFDIEIQNARPLGRMVIQLCTEACPAVVVEFMRCCIGQESDKIQFNRLMAPLWIEGDLTFDHSNALMAAIVEHDMRVLDHGDGSGILSFPCHYLRGSKRSFISFSISFKPLKVLNGRRVAFGKVKEGLWILEALLKVGSRKSGKPLKKINITRCGIMI